MVVATALLCVALAAPAAISGPAPTPSARRALELWRSPARLGMTGAAEMALRRRLGLFEAPAERVTTWWAPAQLQAVAGSDVRVNDPAGDFKSACTTQSETTIVAIDDMHLVTAFNDSGEGCQVLDSYTGFAYSSDGGKTWTDGGRIVPPRGGFSAGDPSLAVDRQGRVYLASLEYEPGMNPTQYGTALVAGRSMLGVRTSDDYGHTWSEPADGTAGMLGEHDKELLTVDNSGGPNDGNVYLVWTDFDSELAGGRGVITFSRSTDRGKTWSDPIRLSRNNEAYNQGAVPVVGPNGELYVTWQTQLTATPGIWMTTSLDGGETFSLPQKIRTFSAPGHALDSCGRQGMDGDIRMLGWPVVAVDSTPVADPEDPPPYRGTIYITYAAKSGVDEGDIYLIRSTDGGLTWGSPVRVNDDATALDQFQPGIATKPNGEVAVFWYDRRNDPSNIDIEVFAARSTDGGQSFGPNLKVSDAAFEGVGNNTQRDPGVAACYMGDYMQLAAVSDGYVATWGDNRDMYPSIQGVGYRSDPNVYFDRFSFPS